MEKKICPKCGKELDADDFWKTSNGCRYRLCKVCAREQRREQYRKTRKRPDGIFYNAKCGRIVEHNGRSTRIFWSKDMLDMLREYYPNTRNQEVVEMLGVSQRTMIRKARELGLQKEKDFVHGVWDENRKLAILTNKVRRNSGMISKGHVPWNKGLKKKS